MKLLRVFVHRNSYTPDDPMAFVGSPPENLPDADRVHISVVFTWDIPEAERLKQEWSRYYDDVRLGGPAYGSPYTTFHPGRYLKQGITFTSRGCNNHCPWCLVPEREGPLRELDDIAPGNWIQDNNLLQCSRKHLDRVWAMLRSQRAIRFPGGLDSRLLTPEIGDAIRGLHVAKLHLACDTEAALVPLARAVKNLKMSREKVKCYVLLAFEPGLLVEDYEYRLREVFRLGAMPFAQLYQPPNQVKVEYDREWKALARVWSRPAAIKAHMKEVDRGLTIP